MSDSGEQWSCPECTLLNALCNTSCEACGSTSPLVLQSYQMEEATDIDRTILQSTSSSTYSTSPKTTTRPSRGDSVNSVSSHKSDRVRDRNHDADLAAELDPWTQAQEEWDHVEAHQQIRKRK